MLGDDEEVLGDLADRPDHEQLAQVGDEVGGEAGRVAPGAAERRRSTSSAALPSSAAIASAAPKSSSASATPSTASTSSVAISLPL